MRNTLAIRSLGFLLTLAMLQVTVYITACAVAYRLISFGSIILPGPPFIFPLTYAISDVVAELYGPQIAKQLIVLSLVGEVLFALIVKLIIYLPSPTMWPHEQAYMVVLDPIFSFTLAGIVAVSVSSWVNVNVLLKLKILTRGQGFWWRSIASSAVGGLVLVSLTMIVGYSETMPLSDLYHMGVAVYILELLYAVMLAWPAWPAWMLIGIVKYKQDIQNNIEKIGAYRKGIDFFKSLSLIKDRKTPFFKIIDIIYNRNKMYFELQLTGKNITFRHTADEIVNNKKFYESLSFHDKKIIDNSISQQKNMKDKISVLKIKTGKIVSMTQINEARKNIYTLQISLDNKMIYHTLSARDILYNKDLMILLNSEEKIEIAFNAGVEEILEEQQQIKDLASD
jgi:uncharacterized integral membrane protein (TIGR00697 family)